jgi:DinB superfamily
MKNLAPIFEFLKTSRAQFISTADEIPEPKWRQSPATDVWSPAEIVTHVGMIEEAIIAGCQKTSRAAPRPVPLLKKIHAPLALATWRGKRVRSPLSPAAGRVHDRQESYAALDATRQASLAFMEALRERDLSEYRFPHPVFGSLNIYDWYRFIGYHELRHRKQIRELVEIFHR